jgi:C-terminal processing protease CtpA/Prc
MFSQHDYETTIVTIPPGRVGIHLEDFISDVSSTIVSAVSPSSPLAGKVVQGDSIIAVNGVDVRKMDTSGKNIIYSS